MINLKNLNLEIFASGFITLIIVIFITLQKVFLSKEILQTLESLAGYNTFLIITIIIFSYVVGLILNDLGFYLTNYFFVKRIKKKYFLDKNLIKYNQIKAKVFENSSIMSERLDFYHNTIRLARSLIISFSISLLYSLYLSGITIISFFFLIFILMFLLKLNDTSHRYYKEMYATYKVHNE